MLAHQASFIMTTSYIVTTGIYLFINSTVYIALSWKIFNWSSLLEIDSNPFSYDKIIYFCF